MDEILDNVGELLFDQPPIPSDSFTYGSLTLSPAKKSGKASTLLADAIFNSSLVLTEQIELGYIPIDNERILEIGSGCGLPSLYAASTGRPKNVIMTDYPDPEILDPLKQNLVNSHVENCYIYGYKWGEDVTILFNIPYSNSGLFSILFLSDVLWLQDEHTNLINTCENALQKTNNARIYITCGDYTKKKLVENFLTLASKFSWDEVCGPLLNTPFTPWKSKENISLQNLNERKSHVWIYHLRWKQKYI